MIISFCIYHPWNFSVISSLKYYKRPCIIIMHKVRRHPHVPNNHHPVSLVIPRFTNMFSVKDRESQWDMGHYRWIFKYVTPHQTSVLCTVVSNFWKFPSNILLESLIYNNNFYHTSYQRCNLVNALISMWLCAKCFVICLNLSLKENSTS